MAFSLDAFNASSLSCNGFSVSSSYSFNSQKNYFAKLPRDLGPQEDSLTDLGLD